MNDWIAVFKAGTHTDSNGNVRTWTEADLDAIVKKYNHKEHEAPVVIGHPKDNAPAYGWVERLERKGSVLYAKLKDLVPEFVDMVKRGLFKKRSISLYPDMTLRHIGFLGAMPPAIKGLPDFAFGDDGGLTIEFEDGSNGLNGSKKKEERTMKFFDWIKGHAAKEGVTIEDAPPTFSESEVLTKVSEALKEKEREFEEKQRQIDAELRAREDAIRLKEAEFQKMEIEQFMEGLRKKGIITPAMEKLGMGITQFMQAIAPISTVEFSEGDAKKNQTPLEFMKAFLSSLPSQIEFREIAGSAKDIGGTGTAESRLDAKTREMMKAKNVSYAVAFAEVQKENSELAQEYASELRGGK